ncbi:MAG: hypothetical protein ACM3U1_06580 [Chloroflexota bacterium]
MNKVFWFLSLAFIATSCIFIKAPQEEATAPKITLSPKPETPMSDEIVRSNEGDMISQIPAGWFFIDVEKEVSPEVMAVAVSPDYTLAAVFQQVRPANDAPEIVKKEGLLGLARICYSKRDKKTAGGVRLSGKYQPLEMGAQRFVEYAFTGATPANRGKSAVFISQTGRYYEMSVIPMNITGAPMQGEDALDRYFRSILATVRY